MAKKTFTEAEKAAWKEEKASELNEQKELFGKFLADKKLSDIVKLMANIQGYDYSPCNRIFIAWQAQIRGLSNFKGICNNFFQWKKQGCTITSGKGSGLMVWAPIKYKKEIKDDSGKIVKEEFLAGFYIRKTAFDISQTSGFDDYMKAEEEIDKKIYSNVEIDYNKAKQFVLDNFGADLTFKEDINSGKDEKGSYNPAQRIITINHQKSHTVFHELGHYLGITKHPELDQKDYSKNEIIAEIFCFQLTKMFGGKVEDYNFNYSNVWANRITEKFEEKEFFKIYKKIEEILKIFFV